jgi:hypothetical protein
MRRKYLNEGSGKISEWGNGGKYLNEGAEENI